MRRPGWWPALQQQGRAAQVEGLLDLPEDHRLGEDPALGVAGQPVEGAEVAVGDAEVGVVDVAVDDEGDLVGRRVALAREPRRGPHGHQVAGGQQGQRVLVAQAPAARDALQHVQVAGVGGERGHGRSLRRQHGQLVELAGGPGELQEPRQAAPLGLAEAVAQAAQVPADELGREREARRRGAPRPPRGRPRSGTGPRAAARRAPRAPAGSGPRRRARAAQTANTMGRPVRSRQRSARSVRYGAKGATSPCRASSAMSRTPSTSSSAAPGGSARGRKRGAGAEQDAKQRHRGRAVRGDGHAPHLLEGDPREELDRVDGAGGGDRRHRHQRSGARAWRA